MRIYILLVFVGVVELTAADHFSLFKREIAARSGLLERQKRASIFDEMLEPSCEDKCDLTLQSNVNMTGFDGTENPFSFLTFNSSSLEAVCNQYQASKSCYAQCPKKSTSTSTVYHMICEEKKAELLKHAPCYEAAEDASESFCEAQCGSIDTIMNATDMTMSSTNVEDMASFGKIFDAMRPLCKFLECAIGCGAEIFTKQCPNDTDAGTFFKDMATVCATTTLHDLNSLDVSLGLHLMPNECRALIGPIDVPVTEDGHDEESGSESLFPENSYKPASGMSEMQQKLMEKQAIIYDKTSRNLDVELQKLNLEKLLLEKQLKQ
uniref:Chondroitin proteoglycan 4 domain-containing protein n=1 Tax=Plectus sambesii TaxID=2011161 RepID=A0A914UZ55_9BILA